MGFEEIVARQSEIFSAILKLEENVKKERMERRTVEIYEKYLNRLKELFEEYMQNDDVLRPQERAYATDKYWSDRTKCDDTQKIIKGMLKAKIQELTTSTTGIGNTRTDYPGTGNTGNHEITTFEDESTTSSNNKLQGESSKLKGTTEYSSSKIIRNQGARMNCLENQFKKIWRALETEVPRGYLTQQLKSIASTWSIIESQHYDIIASDDQHAAIYTHNNNFDDLQEEYLQITAKVESTMSDQRSSGSTNNIPIHINLPKLNATIFRGDYTKWPEFRDIFVATILNNNMLTNTERLIYLKNSLTGEAASVIKHLSCVENNFETAWKLINNRYNNKRLMLSAQLTTLLGIPTANAESVGALKNLHDTINESIHAINNLGINTENWDPIIVHMMAKKLDKDSLRQYETTLEDPTEIPTLKSFMDFLERRFMSLQAASKDYRFYNPSQTNKPTNFNSLHHFNKTTTLKANPMGKVNSFASTTACKRSGGAHSLSTSSQSNKTTTGKANYGGKINSFETTTISCRRCGGAHALAICNQFKNDNYLQRTQLVNLVELCRICLLEKHSPLECRGNKCRVCGGNHHELLHTAKCNDQLSKEAVSANHGAVYDNKQKTLPASTLLSTALVKVMDGNRKAIFMRMLIDPGSQATFMTKEAANKILSQEQRTHVEIAGIGQSSAGVANKMKSIWIKPHFTSDFSIQLDALVVENLTKLLPEAEFDISHYAHLNNLDWADPEYNKPGKIDILMGADHYSEIVLNGIIKGRVGEPIAQSTSLGWIIFGKIVPQTTTIRVNSFLTTSEIDEQLKRFWEIEEINQKKPLTKEEQDCIEFYDHTTVRLEDGRYEVEIPFNNKCEDLGESRSAAFTRYLQLEQRFRRNPKLYEAYKMVMDEYLKYDHMEEVNSKTLVNKKNYYLPHHAVFKESSTTTKLRVVFDASAKTTTDVSLNECMMIGPTIQQTLIEILIRWRKHKVAFTADIEKMYRQIKIKEKDQDYQLIFWRCNVNEPIRIFKLKTVTFGTAAAPFLATKTLQRLADDEMVNYPHASEILRNDFYVDDLLSGADTVDEAAEIQKQLSSLLATAGFNLRKWTCNHPEVLMMDREENNYKIELDPIIKTLGITWNSREDVFEINMKMVENKHPPTKRLVLSEISKLFDPLGWISPIIVVGKLLMQDLWIKGLDWDKPLPEDVKMAWNKFHYNFREIKVIKIPRWIGYTKGSTIELCGFSDASEKAYAAVVYARSIQEDGIHINLIAAKTKVAPIANRLTLPKLELCAANLLCELIEKIKNSFLNEKVVVYAWTDSKITLAWIHGLPHKWKTFVANRVANIHKVSTPKQWRYVKSKDNPADVASRGLSPLELSKCKIWWNGPDWLRAKNFQEKEENFETEEEIRKATPICMTLTTEIPELLNRYSSYSQTYRIIAYIYRFINNCSSKKKKLGPITINEMDDAKVKIVMIVQAIAFAKEIEQLKCKGIVSNHSELKLLTPILDENGLIRVGGRLMHATLNFNQKHPLILPKNTHLTKIIIEWGHEKTLHGGVNLTLSYVRNWFWILDGKRMVRKCISKCLKCIRYNARTSQQIMGNLPKPRVTISKPFTHTGIDYAGPIQLRVAKHRGSKTMKGYIAVFVCLTTKAFHLELVSDLTTIAFFAAFDRFVARRGNVTDVYSDNATNFVGANKIMMNNQNSDLNNHFTKREIRWHFIPPASPNFGGLWEAGVKSVKGHLQKIIRERLLTYEELSTFLCMVEACLNSRPLSPMSADIDDLDVLTPGHFLIGSAMLAPCQRNTNAHPENLTSRWKILNEMNNVFWKKWKTEYLTNLQKRPKWLKKHPNIQLGQLLLVKTEDSEPTKWPLARVLEIHPGSDGIVRVVTLKCRDKILKRPLNKLCLLPNDFDENLTHQNEKAKNIEINIEGTEKTNHNERRVQPPRRANLRPVIASMLCILTLQGITFAQQLPTTPSTITSHYTITQFNNTPGLYFSKIGDLRLTTLDWNIVVYINMTNYWAELNELDSAIQNLRGLIEYHMTNPKHQSEFTMLQYLYHQIEQKNVLIEHHTGGRSKRSAPLAFIGNLLGDVIGTLDERSAKNFQMQIQKIQQNEEHTISLMKSQTSIVESTTNIIKKQQINIEKIWSSMKHHEEESENIRNQIEIMSLITHSILLMSNFQRNQDLLLAVLIDMKKQEVNYNLLLPEQLQKEIEKMRPMLPEGTNFPVLNEPDRMKEWYQLMKCRGQVLDNLAVFTISIPLISLTKFSIFRSIPLPTTLNNQTVFIQPDTEMLAVNTHLDEFYHISNEELGECEKIIRDSDSEKYYICPQIHAILKEGVTCEHQLFQSSIRSSIRNVQDCNIIQSTPKDRWISIGRNDWIYVAIRKKQIHIACNNHLYEETIEHEGTLRINDSCIVKDNTMVLSAQRSMDSRVEAIVIPKINVSEIVAIKTKANLNISTNINTDAIDALEQRLKRQMKDLDAATHSPSIHDIHHYSISYSTLIIIIIISILFCVYRHRTRATTEHTTIQMDRQLPATGARPLNQEDA